MTMVRMRSIVLAIMVLAAPHVVLAQFPGGGGMGGGGMAGRPGGMPGQMGANMSREFKEMARLKPLLKNVKLSDVQKDSLKTIEESYAQKLGDYGKAMEALLRDAGPGSPPDMEELQRLRVDARALQEEEFALARAAIDATEHARFDENLTKYRDDEDKREARRREQMRGMGRPGGGPPMGGGLPF
jgi:hypothetical protein